MPTFVPHITVDLDELLQDRAVTSNAFGGKSSRVVVMAVDVALVLVIRVLCSEKVWADGTRKMLDVKLLA